MLPMSESPAIVISSDDITFHRWKSFFVAACKIQRAYRTYLRRSIGCLIFKPQCRRENIHESANVQQLLDLGKILIGGATNDEKLDMWRYVIEIRKMRPQHSSDSCIRSLTECNGDLQRTLIVTGNAEFRHRNADDLPQNQRNILLPNTKNKSHYEVSEHSSLNPARGSFRDLRNLKNIKSHRNDDASLHASGKFDLKPVISKIYFSKP